MADFITPESLGLAVETTEAPVAKTVVLSPKAPEVLSPSKKLTEEERLQNRIKKFGAQTEEVKKQTRAERFGVKTEENGSNGTAATTEAKAAKDARAARFGIETKEAKAASKAAVKASPEVTKEQLDKRTARFGNVKEEAAKPATDETLNKRKERFGTLAEDDKKKLRSERFQTKA